ncbi:DUF2911 domain-containing protein [Faecalibacter bovis]|uniref:DUF2911 domain-containing protein n=1 Tax=Faecalibacter bovis TaxID=2898187 RepID=A0ABX7XB76_9FLAO|nr:DUF2911 domain-containing protein [Faecalibacter bovis]MBS7333308.1 DUF2911 domain-containing protein [Weeksellaceae bacterium]QTV05166.1 DUF2911 domain-containing protein [Faecalibacter bovis]
MKFKTTILALLVAGFSYAQIQFPQASSKAEVEQTIGYTDIEIDYFRPNLNNRAAFGGLVPYGEVWRTGANNNTTIDFSTDVLVGGKQLAKGKYSLYTIPGKTNWDIIFYKTTENWGNPKQWDESQIALKVNVPVQTLTNKVETFTINFDNVNVNQGDLVITWDNVKVNVKVEAPTKKIAQENISKGLKADSSARDFYGAANYYFLNNLDLKKAQEWINTALEKDAKAPQHFKDLKAKIDSALKK